MLRPLEPPPGAGRLRQGQVPAVLVAAFDLEMFGEHRFTPQNLHDHATFLLQLVDFLAFLVVEVAGASESDPVLDLRRILDQDLATSFFEALIVSQEDLKIAEISHHLFVSWIVLQCVQVCSAGLIIVSVKNVNLLFNLLLLLTN